MEDEKEKNEKRNVFDDIIEDAKIPRTKVMEWNGKEIEIKYKVLIGDEDSEIERKYGDDVVKILLEKTFLMIMKANNGLENDMTREQWNALPGKFRTALAMEINLDRNEKDELFRNLQQSQKASS